MAAASQQLAQLPHSSSCALGLRTQAGWNSDLARGLRSFTEAAYLQRMCPSPGRFPGATGVRELSSECLFKNKEINGIMGEVNQSEALGRKTISIWGKR